jgi:hypothetical protein
MKFGFIAVVIMGLSLNANAEMAVQTVKTLFKAARPAASSAVETAAKEGLSLKVWQRNSLFVSAKKNGENYDSISMRVEKVNSSSPNYEDAILQAVKNLDGDVPRGYHVSANAVDEDGAKIIHVHFPTGISKETANSFIQLIQKKLSGGHVGYPAPGPAPAQIHSSYLKGLKAVDEHLKNSGSR